MPIATARHDASAIMDDIIQMTGHDAPAYIQIAEE